MLKRPHDFEIGLLQIQDGHRVGVILHKGANRNATAVLFVVAPGQRKHSVFAFVGINLFLKKPKRKKKKKKKKKREKKPSSRLSSEISGPLWGASPQRRRLRFGSKTYSVHSQALGEKTPIRTAVSQ
jgi:hypothetical protein